MSSSSDKLLAIIILRYFILDTNLICLLFTVNQGSVAIFKYLQEKNIALVFSQLKTTFRTAAKLAYASTNFCKPFKLGAKQQMSSAYKMLFMHLLPQQMSSAYKMLFMHLLPIQHPMFN